MIVLIGGRNPDLRNMLATALRHAGYGVRPVETWEQVMLLCETVRAALLVVDGELLAGGSVDLLSAGRAIAVPKIVLGSGSGDAAAARSFGADRYLTLPFSTRALHHAVASLTARR